MSDLIWQLGVTARPSCAGFDEDEFGEDKWEVLGYFSTLEKAQQAASKVFPWIKWETADTIEADVTDCCYVAIFDEPIDEIDTRCVHRLVGWHGIPTAPLEQFQVTE